MQESVVPMSTVVTEPEAVENPEYDPSEPDLNLLEDKMPDWFRTTPMASGFMFLMAITAFIFSWKPLWHTDLWGHLAYGRLLWQTGSLPVTEPLMPLSKGIPFVDSAWLSQLIGFGAWQVAGKAAIGFLYAVTIAASVGILMRRVYSRTQSGMFAAIAFGLTLWVNWNQLAVVRPQLAGFLFFCCTVSLVLKRDWRKSSWITVPVMFAFWANMHGSFIVGLGLLGCFTLGRAVDVVRRTGRVGSVLRDTRLRRLFLLTEVAAVATLLNPYGLGLHVDILTFGNNPNLESIIEWQPLNVRMMQGQAAAIVALALFLIYRVSPRRVSAGEMLALAVFGGAALWNSRMLLWWTPVAASLVTIHAATAWQRWRRIERDDSEPERASLWTIMTLGFAVIAFMVTHLGGVALTALAGKDTQKRMEMVAVSSVTPVKATEYLNEHPPSGPIFNSYELGDYLLFNGPKNLQVFVASHAHLVPTEVWDDYMGIIGQASGWQSQLERYGVNTVVLDEQYRGPLIRRMRESGDWILKFKDERSVVLSRRHPI
jgi:hypothetical protein